MRITLQHAHYQDDPTGFYFEIQADGNWETLTTSEIYNDKIDAMATINAFRAAGLEFEFVDLTL